MQSSSILTRLGICLEGVKVSKSFWGTAIDRIHLQCKDANKTKKQKKSGHSNSLIWYVYLNIKRNDKCLKI